MKKSIFLIALAVAMILSIGSCKSDADSSAKSSETESVSQSDLDKIIKEQNKKLPINTAYGMVINKIELIDGYITYICTIDESNLGESLIDNLKMNTNTSKNNIIAGIKEAKDEELGKLIKNCIKLNVGLAYKYIGSISNKTTTIKLDPDELQDAISAKSSETEPVTRSDLEQIIKDQNKMMPMGSGEFVINKVELIDNYITYICTVDESVTDDLYGESFIDYLKENTNASKSYIKTYIKGTKDYYTDKLIKNCIKLNIGIAYKYVGSISNKSITIGLDPDELQ